MHQCKPAVTPEANLTGFFKKKNKQQKKPEI